MMSWLENPSETNNSIFSTVWKYGNYIIENPFQTFAFLFSAYIIADTINLSANNIGIAAGILSQFTTSPITIRANTLPILNTMLVNMFLWNGVGATGPEFLVNTEIMRYSPGTPKIARLSDGSFVVNYAGSSNNINRFNVIENAAVRRLGRGFSAYNFAIASLPDRTFVLIGIENCRDWNPHPYLQWTFCGQRYNATGDATAKLGTEFLVTGYSGSGSNAPVPYLSIADLPDGSFVTASFSSYGILRIQRFSVTGEATPQELGEGKWFVIAANPYCTPTIASLSDGSFVVAWYGNGTTNNNVVYAQRFSAMRNATFVKLSAELHIRNSPTIVSLPIASLPDGGFVVTWYGSDTQESNCVYAQRFKATGNTTTELGPKFLVNTYPTINQGNLAITSLANDSFVVAWYGYGDNNNSSFGIYAQRYTVTENNTKKSGTEFPINTHPTNNQYTPAITSLPDGSFVVTWVSYNQTGSNI